MKIYFWISLSGLVLVLCPLHAEITKQYYFAKTKVNNEEAHSLCARNGMRLASIQSEEERILYERGLLLSGIAEDKSGFVWIAGTIDPSPMWLWKSGDGLVSRQPMNYTNWVPQFPNNSDDFCVLQSLKYYGWKWVNTNCRYVAINVACETFN